VTIERETGWRSPAVAQVHADYFEPGFAGDAPVALLVSLLVVERFRKASGADSSEGWFYDVVLRYVRLGMFAMAFWHFEADQQEEVSKDVDWFTIGEPQVLEIK
jgi:hypothetical protein